MGFFLWRWRVSNPRLARNTINGLHVYLIIHNQQIDGSYFDIVTINCVEFTLIGSTLNETFDTLRWYHTVRTSVPRLCVHRPVSYNQLGCNFRSRKKTCYFHVVVNVAA